MPGRLPSAQSVAIENESGHPVTIDQTSANSRVFHIVNNPRTTATTITGSGAASTLTLTGGHVRNGNGGAILVDNPRNILTLSYVNVVGNSAVQVSRPRLGTKGNGGGIYSSGSVTLNHTSVSDDSANGPNGASGHAGGIYTDQGVTLIASQVDSNSARNAGGLLNVFGSVKVLNGSTVNNNSSYGNSVNTGDLGGGGIGEMAGNVIVSNSQVSDNKTIGMYSGGIVILLGGVTVTDGSQIDGNSNNGPGGGIAANFQGGHHQRRQPGRRQHSAGLEGGIVNFSDTFGISVTGGSQVSHNTLTNDENALATSGLVSVGLQPATERAIVSGGRGDAMLKAVLELFVNACAEAGAIDRASHLRIPVARFGRSRRWDLFGPRRPIEITSGSEISDNTFASKTDEAAIGDGGGVFANVGPITIDSSTISGNIATGDGGGIWNGTSLSITNTLVTQNQAGVNGGGIFNQGTFTSTATSVVDNTPDDIYSAS